MKFVLVDGTYTVSKYKGNDKVVVIPSEYRGIPVTSIGEGAFSGCRSLASVTIPEGVTSIEKSAFFGCGSLISITILSSVLSIGRGALWWCSALSFVVFKKPEGWSACGAALDRALLADPVTAAEYFRELQGQMFGNPEMTRQ